MGRMQLKIAETADFQSFGMARKACAPAGRAMVSYIPAVAAPWKGAQRHNDIMVHLVYMHMSS